MTAPEVPFQAVYFDCDSTLVGVEGIDELLAHVPAAQREELTRLTAAAMDGTMPLATIYEQRLAALAPSRALLEEARRVYCNSLVPDAAKVVRALQHLGKTVGIVSGGLAIPVRGLAELLGIEPSFVHAVELSFDADGNYEDFVRAGELWRNGGKPRLMERLAATRRPVAFVGDGVTDLETQPVVDRFIGFGGVEARPKVRAEAEFFVDSKGLAPVLPLLLTDAEFQTLLATAEFAEFGNLQP